MKDAINPSHYKSGKVEAIDAIEAATVNKFGIEAVCVANVIKYLWRYESKNGHEDIKKAVWYLNKLNSIYNENIRKNHISNDSPVEISGPSKQDQERREEPSLQEQLREPEQDLGGDKPSVDGVWTSSHTAF
jgi:hypothetical protein